MRTDGEDEKGATCVAPRGFSTVSRSALRAGDETRTRDLLLGKEVFYQLNYARDSHRYYSMPSRTRKLGCSAPPRLAGSRRGPVL